jgi:CBS domain containing-hemolysin-like protein
MELLAGAVLILLSGFFSGSETAVYRADWVRLTTWADQRTSGARLALRLLRRREPTVIATLVGTNLCNVFATMLLSGFVARSFGPAWAGVAVVLVVVLTLVFGEFVPKAVAQANPNHWLRQTSLSLAVSRVLFAPVVLLLVGVARLFAAPVGRFQGRFSLTRQDFLAAIRQRERRNGNGTRNDGAAQQGPPISGLVARLFRFSGLNLAEAAIPLERVCSVPAGADRAQILAMIGEHGFSRIPVYRADPANVVGVVFARDLLEAGAVRIRPIMTVAADTRLMEVLDRMQRRRQHIAVVRDADGRATGIVTLEDVLEELVGEIRSED